MNAHRTSTCAGAVSAFLLFFFKKKRHYLALSRRTNLEGNLEFREPAHKLKTPLNLILQTGRPRAYVHLSFFFVRLRKTPLPLCCFVFNSFLAAFIFPAALRLVFKRWAGSVNFLARPILGIQPSPSMNLFTISKLRPADAAFECERCPLAGRPRR